MLLAIVTDTFVLQMVKQVLRNDTFNIAGWFIERKGETENTLPIQATFLGTNHFPIGNVAFFISLRYLCMEL